MHTYRRSARTGSLAVLMFGLFFVVPPIGPLRDTRAWLDPGLMQIESATHTDARTPAASLSSRADPDELLSVIVRLRGSSIGELESAVVSAAVHGTSSAPRATLQALSDAIERRQRPVRQSIEATGAAVVDQYRYLLNGFLVHATPTQIAAIARLPVVSSVARAPLLELALGDSVPHIGAARTWTDPGYRGAGVLVAVLDTGIDYTHAAFGGAGNPADYEANNEDLVESGTFPSGRVVGGYDFAGKRYSPIFLCGPYAGQDCHQEPRPDDDPLDSRGHGTHVAGVIAGQATSDVAAGVAPDAKLVSLKIFGNPVGSPALTDLLGSALEWVKNNNAELDVPGWPTEPIDVVNLSVSGAWLTGWVETERLLRDAAAQGLTIVVAAGNDGSLAYIGDAIAGVDEVLSVAGTWPPNQHGLLLEAQWTGAGGPQRLDTLALDSWIDGQPRAVDRGGFEGDLAWMGLGCNDTPPVQPVSAKVALIERGGCSFAEKITNAQSAGATAVVVFTSADRGVEHMGGQAELGIPAVMIAQAAGQQIAQLLEGGTPVSGRVFEPAYDLLVDRLAAYSSRGPARMTAALRPQISAPGAFIRSAWSGLGSRSSAASGSSAAAAHVSGVAALLAERNRREALGLGALDLAALAINYAVPTVKIERQDTGRLAPIAHQGAGRVDAYRSAGGDTLVRSELGIAELSFGHIHASDAAVSVSRMLTVRNLTADPKRYAVDALYAFPAEDVGAGTTVTVAPSKVTVPGRQTSEIQVTMRADPAALRAWPLTDREAVVEPALLGQAEVDGFIRVAEVDDADQAVAGGDVVGVPFLGLPRRASCVESASAEPFVLPELSARIEQRWLNPCREAGLVRLFSLVGRDDTDSNLPGAVDVDYVGARYFAADPADPDSDHILSWLIHTREPRRVPGGTQFRVYLDLNQDGEFDWVVYNMYGPELALYVDADYQSGRWVVGYAPLVPGTLIPDYPFTGEVLYYQAYELDETATRLSVVAEDLGINFADGLAVFDVGVMVSDAAGDYPLVGGELAVDYVPDGLLEGDRLPYDQFEHDCLVPFNDQIVPAEGDLTLEIAASCDAPASGEPLPVGLVMSYPANLPGAAQLEMRTGQIGGEPTPVDGVRIFLPYGAKQ